MIQTAIPVGIVTLAVVYADHMIGSILLIIGIALVLLWLLPSWANWLAVLVADREYDFKTNTTRTPAVVAGEIELSRLQAQIELAKVIATLSVNQVDYAREMNLLPVIDISTRITWTVGNTVMPVTFARDWYDAYLKRPEKQLPGDADFSAFPQRDVCRQYNHVLTDAICKSGLARHPGGPQPARWLIADKAKQDEVLAGIGLWTALDVCNLIMYQEAEAEE